MTTLHTPRLIDFSADDRAALERVAAALSMSARATADRLVATCRETAFRDCGESSGP